MKIRRILVPVDGSDSAVRALQEAALIAAVCQSEIHLLYVSYLASDTDSKVEMVSWLPEEAVGSVAKVTEAILSRAQAMVAPQVKCQAYARTGIPAKEILAFAKAQAIDLIVMGGRGLGIVERILLGSVSQSVLENAEVPVLIVK